MTINIHEQMAEHRQSGIHCGYQLIEEDYQAMVIAPDSCNNFNEPDVITIAV